MQNQKQSNTNNQFLQLPYDLLSATSYVGKGGVVVPITLQQKIIYCWMKQRCEFFAQDKREYFDNVDDIADSVKINRKTVMGAIKTFTDTGVLVASKKPQGGNRAKWVFKRFSELVLIQPEQKTADTPVAPSATVSVSDDAPALDVLDNALDDAVPAGADWACEAVPLDAYDEFLPEPEDDGSSGDAFAYEAFEALPVAQETQEAKPIIVQAPATVDAQFEDMPDKRFCRNGDLSAEMLSWCKTKGIKIVEDDYDHNFLIDGKRHIFNNGSFVECNIKKTTKPRNEEEISSPF